MSTKSTSAWGFGLVRLMRFSAVQRSARDEKPQHVTGDHTIGDVLNWFPETEAVLLHYGMVDTPLCSQTGQRNLSSAAFLRGVPLRALLFDLNTAAFRIPYKPVRLSKHRTLRALAEECPSLDGILHEMEIDLRHMGSRTLAEIAGARHQCPDELIAAICARLQNEDNEHACAHEPGLAAC